MFYLLVLAGGVPVRAENATEFVRVPWPKLILTPEWRQRNPTIPIPRNLTDTMVSILGMIDGKTAIATADGRITLIDGTIQGDHGELEQQFEQRGDQDLPGLLPADTVNVLPFESLGLPSFNPEGGTSRGAGARQGGIAYRNIPAALEIMVHYNQSGVTTDTAGIIWATFTLTAEFQNTCAVPLSGVAAAFRFIGESEAVYYSSETMKFVRLLPREKQWAVVQISAPADDFSLRMLAFIDGDTVQFANRTEFTAWREDWAAFREGDERKFAWHSTENLNQLLGYATTREKYRNVLALLAVVHVGLNWQDRMLPLIDRVRSEGGGPFTLEYLDWLRVVALIKLRHLSAAVAGLCTIKNEACPPLYRDYLIRSCLRQIEREQDLARAEANPENARHRALFLRLRATNQAEFSANFWLSMFPFQQRANEQIVDRLTVPRRWNSACEKYTGGEYEAAKIILQELLSTAPDRQVVDDYDTYTLAPAACEILGKIAIREGDARLAEKYFRTMIDTYPNEPLSLGNPAGAEGRCRLIELKLQQVDGRPIEDAEVLAALPPRDYPGALVLARELVEHYDRVPFNSLYNGGGGISYEIIAVDYVEQCLTEMRAPALALIRIDPDLLMKTDPLQKSQKRFGMRRDERGVSVSSVPNANMPSLTRVNTQRWVNFN